jgi:hypothetical protein
MPKIDESRKRKAEESSAPTKKAKIEVYIYSTSDWLIYISIYIVVCHTLYLINHAS